MRRYLKILALVAVLGLAAAACGGGDEGGGTTGATAQTGATGATGATGEEAIQPGGTLKLAMLGDVSDAWDPQKSYYSVNWSFYRCCLLRTLMSYNGKPVGEGGSELFPDIAATDPEVSADGLTWTFTLKPDVFYAPPFQDVAVTSADIVRAITREADPDASVNGYSFYYSPIEGFDDCGSGCGTNGKTVTGLETPDDTTLVVHLTHPAGETPFLFALPASAPIPPDAPDEVLGAAEGHTKDYGLFMVATGPYMFAGTEALDFSLPADEQTPISSVNVGKSYQLVRNPSWDPATDDLRPAYVDGLDITVGGDNNDLYNKVEAGEIDLVVDGIVPPELLRKYSTDPALQPRLQIWTNDGVRYLEMNLAEPPFDDIHIRKAVNLAIDKAGMRLLRGGELVGNIAGHIITDGLTGNLLADYDPYATPNSAGDVTAAQAEIAQSQYDANGDGVCDDPVCDGVLAITDEADPYPDQAALITENLAPLGITLDVKSFERTTMYNKCLDPASHMGICLAPGWFKDFPDAYTFGPPLFGSSALYPSCCNRSLIGASPEFLADAGYDITDVPSADAQMDECVAMPAGDERVACWADIDRLLMEEYVPFVPYIYDNSIDLLSERIVNYSYDQDSGLAAWDRLAIAPDAQ